MDTTAFFNYPAIAAAAPTATSAPAAELELLPGATVEDWDAVLAATETLRFRPRDVVLRAGARDRAFYLLLDGQLAAGEGDPVVAAPALVGAAAFADGRPRAVTLTARTHGELARMSWDAYEALAARDPRLGRAILAGLAAGLAARLRAAGTTVDGWTG